MKDKLLNSFKALLCGVACLVAAMFTQSCSDEPSGENYYTFTGEMMSDYITNRPQYSDFAYILRQAGLWDLMTAYGHYTLFLPTNDAVNKYLTKIGKATVEDLSKEDCDTLARMHLVNNMYSTTDLYLSMVPSDNMLGQPIQVSDTVDADRNPTKLLNRESFIIYNERDDSVQNGIVQPVTAVLENANTQLGGILEQNPRVSMFYEVLRATGLVDSLAKVRDTSYDPTKYSDYYYTSDFWKEKAVVPSEKKYGFTAFVEPNEVYEKRLSREGISTSEGTVRALYELACKLYDPVYGNDPDYQEAHDFSKITERYNPLNMFVAYHILTRDVIGYSKLTPIEITGRASLGTGAIGIKTDRMNPNDWYETLCPHTMLKVEQATVRDYLGSAVLGQRYINRRVDETVNVAGSLIQPEVESVYQQNGLNGRYFYIDDVIAFDTDTQNKVFNDRIRMDFATVWPEVMTENIRLNGDPKHDDSSDGGTVDETYRYGKNYYFPDGYLDHVTMRGNGTLVYRRPHWNFWSYEGDEFNLFGDYDITFRLPPVPYEGDYQIRLGFCALKTRGVAQIYYDGKPQGIPIDMRVFLNEDAVLGNKWASKNWASMTDEEKAEDQKVLKNLGYYRGANGGFHTSGSSINEFVDNYRTYRRVLCTVHINPKQDHYLRIRCTSTSKLGNNNEFMMDYLEIVPKSIYGVTGTGKMETDL